MKKFVYICVLVSLFSLFCPVVYATSTEQTYDDISEYLQDYSPVTDEHVQDYEASTGLANWENSISDYDTSYYSSGNRLWTVLLCLCAIIIFVDLERLFKKAGYAG